jgi:F-type H+-transporting ATPase subunit gamma
MEMVSASKLTSARKALCASQDYFARIENILGNLLASFKGATHPLLGPRPGAGKGILLCPLTSDTGLCGNYNSAIMHTVDEFIRKHSACNISLLAIGKKGFKHFKKLGLTVVGSYTDFYGRYSSSIAKKVEEDLINMYLAGSCDEVYFAYTKFLSAARQTPVTEKVLGIEVPGGVETQYLLEPDIGAILNELIPLYVFSKIKAVLLSAFTSEHSTRVMAMHEATDNARELLEDLVLLRNKMRQANITVELIEVVSAFDALKG